MADIEAPAGMRRLEPAVRVGLAPALSVRDAEAWAMRLARTHYENFPVLSLLLPRRLRQDFANIYGYCRVADDLADEMGDADAALAALAEFRHDLRACFAGEPSQRVFVALGQTVRRHDLPLRPLSDLLDAFEQDQRVRRYETFDELLGYCRRSANPVGRIVLWLCGYRDEARARLSDCICTALQLTNFWQDVRRDMLERDRIYIPRESMERFGVTEAQLAAGEYDSGFRQLLQHEVARTAELFDRGEALLPMLRPAVRAHVAMFRRGGRAILDAIRQRDYDTLSARPALSRGQKLSIVASGMIEQARQCLGLAQAPGGQLGASYRYCRRLTRRKAHNFYWGLRLLPEPKRSAMYVLYAWMRLADDMADDGEDALLVDHRKERLVTLRAQTAQAFDGTCPDAGVIWPAFSEVVRRYRLRADIFEDAIAGQAQDLEPVCFSTEEELRQYCYRVAGTVGLASIYIWGFEGGAETEAMAIDLGLAMQLTNILRDLREDLGRGRLYLPAEELRAAGVSVDQISRGEAGEPLSRFMREQIARARAAYERAADLPRRVSPDCRPALRAMVGIYRALLEKIAARPEQVLHRRVRLSTWAKLRIGWSALRAQQP